MSVWGEVSHNGEAARADKKTIAVKHMIRRSVLPDEGSLDWKTRFADRTQRIIAGYGEVDPNNAKTHDFPTCQDAIDYLDEVLEGVRDFRLIFLGLTVLHPYRVMWPKGANVAPSVPAQPKAPPRERVMAVVQNGDIQHTTPPEVLGRHRKYIHAHGHFMGNLDKPWCAIVRGEGGMYEVRVRNKFDRILHCNTADGVHQPNPSIPKLPGWRR